jgi:hypothetical protein
MKTNEERVAEIIFKFTQKGNFNIFDNIYQQMIKELKLKDYTTTRLWQKYFKDYPEIIEARKLRMKMKPADINEVMKIIKKTRGKKE